MIQGHSVLLVLLYTLSSMLYLPLPTLPLPVPHSLPRQGKLRLAETCHVTLGPNVIYPVIYLISKSRANWPCNLHLHDSVGILYATLFLSPRPGPRTRPPNPQWKPLCVASFYEPKPVGEHPTPYSMLKAGPFFHLLGLDLAGTLGVCSPGFLLCVYASALSPILFLT
ncbi:hypothetical protein FA13DRAFT_1090708 [Coprinellus micaceus]|uniref:Uncharacterized protein n=1 Tax=Coprinellus micaceus TaxID=71717 RepID=A0A4Y7TSJ8_COPMI|nr:hypothetical protein FA13DRAFT_1090708 [Coprinellus micaceus]